MREVMGAARSAFQHHHLLPLSLLNRPQIGRFLAQLHLHGLKLNERASNCLWLPADEALSLRLGHALHRGPHPNYTNVVAERVERIRQRHSFAGQSRAAQWLAKEDAVARLKLLQRAMSHVLSGPGPRLLQLNRRDPMRCFSDCSYLDDAISRMFAQRD